MSQSKAFFSFDAAAASFSAIILFALFSILSFAASNSAKESSAMAEGELLALRFSSYVLEKGAKVGLPQEGAHYVAGEIDLARLEEFDLQEIVKSSGIKYASVLVAGERKERLFFKEAGEAGKQVFCARRLALLSGEAVRLEACIS
ncbi:MAG: hypothetical protein N3G22_01250 [Candidatus Micrarchaeota archaeon]|nr:hypothetical protein [Candidatus Micrarchaeota archaeon]